MTHPSTSLPARSRIYRYLYQNRGFCSRQDLARELNVSMPTVYQKLSSLIEEGLVGYSGEYRATGGRRVSGLVIIPDVRITIGIYLTRDRLRIVASDLLLNVVAADSCPFPHARQFLSEGNSFSALTEEFLNKYQIPREKILGVCAAMPGTLTPDGMHLLRSPTMQLENIDLHGLGEGIPYPFRIVNDAAAGGNAEMFLMSNHENIIYLFLEDGVGGMLKIGGTIYNGDHNMSGEFGHICVQPGGLRCNCGKRGCLEAYCSNYRLSTNLGITLQEFFDDVHSANAEYALLWDDYLLHLAIGITNLHTALDCDVVLGGHMIRYLRPYMPVLKEYLKSLSQQSEDVSFLHLGTIEDYPAPLGAALYFIQDFVESI